MSPSYWNSVSSLPNKEARVFYTNTDGSFTGASVNNSPFGAGIRPVINLRSDVTFNSGSDGTQNNPYIVQ